MVNQLPVVWFGEPLEMDQRLVTQSGLFVLPGVLDQPLHRILDGYVADEPVIVKYVLPLDMRAQVMQSLYRMPMKRCRVALATTAHWGIALSEARQ